LDPKTSAQHAKAPERALLLRAEQVIAPRDRGAHRLLALREIARTDGGEQHVAIEATEQFVWRQSFHPRRRELQRERQRVELLTDRLYRGAVLRRETEVGLHVTNPLDEQAHCRDAVQISRFLCTERERADREFALSPYAQRRAAGDEELECGNRRQ